MTKTPLLLTFIVVLLASAPAAAQSAYQVDNFDLPNAVQIHTPKAEPKTKRLLRLTSMPLNPSLGM